MSKNLFIVLGAVAVVTVSAGAFYVLSGKSGVNVPGAALLSQNDQEYSQGKANKDGAISQTMSFLELMKLGENYTCTFSDVSEDATVNGTVYVAGKENKFRTDYNTDTSVGLASGSMSSTKQTGSMITDGEYTYIWDSSSKEGIKMKFTEQDKADLEENMKDLEGYRSAETKNDASAFDQNAEMNYDCKRWSVDNSVFTPPSDIVFTDFAEQMNQFQGIMDSYDSYQQ